MFKWLNKQGVESTTKGFVVQSIDRFTIEYKEGNKHISLYVERGFLPDGKVCVYITPKAFQKWDDGVLISTTKQIELLKNFKEAMEFQGVAVLVD